LAFLADQGADIARHNLANDPMAFASDETVRAFLQVAGSEGLPLTTVDGVTVMTGTYPSREQLTRFTGSSLLTISDDSDGASSECGPTGCC
jgi:arsenite-transporting ATPase